MDRKVNRNCIFEKISSKYLLLEILAYSHGSYFAPFLFQISAKARQVLSANYKLFSSQLEQTDTVLKECFNSYSNIGTIMAYSKFYQGKYQRIRVTHMDGNTWEEDISIWDVLKEYGNINVGMLNLSGHYYKDGTEKYFMQLKQFPNIKTLQIQPFFTVEECINPNVM